MKDYITFGDFTNLDIEKQYELLVIRDNKISLLEERIEELEMENRKLKKDVLDGEIHWHSQKRKRLLEKRRKEKYKQRNDKAIKLLKTLDEDTLSNMQLALETIGHIEYVLRGEDNVKN